MRIFRSASFLTALCFVAACKVGNGDFSGFDSSIGFDGDASRGRDAARPHDAGAVHEDAGHESADAAPPDAGSGFGAADAPALFARAVCAALRDCMGTAQLVDYLSGSDCETSVARQQADRELHWLADSVTAKRVVLHPSAATQCYADLRAYGCQVNSHRMPASCQELISGKVALDGQCSIDQECSGDAYCDKGLSSVETCPGTCSAFQSAGLPCLASRECVDGLLCRNMVCVAPLKVGDACETANGQPTCPPGLVCQGQTGKGTCQPRTSVFVGKIGGSCDVYGALCQSGLVCESTSGTAGKCAAPASAGGACKRAKPNQCPSDQTCDAASAGVSGTCQPLPTDGQACVRQTCAPDQVCLSGTCYALAKAGSACVAAAQCYSGTCDNSLCVTPIECQL